MRPRILVFSGAGPHGDPWHALDATSAALARVLADVARVEVVPTAAGAAEAIGTADLVVVNASGDLAAPAADSAPIVDLLDAHHRARRPILALHSSSLAFADDARWATILGGRWVPGATMHPQIGHALVQDAHPRGHGIPRIDDFVLYDERYCGLERDSAAEVVALHTEDGLTHPLIWWRHAGAAGGAVAYDALGHGVESYESAPHRSWLVAAATALLATTGVPHGDRPFTTVGGAA